MKFIQCNVQWILGLVGLYYLYFNAHNNTFGSRSDIFTVHVWCDVMIEIKERLAHWAQFRNEKWIKKVNLVVEKHLLRVQSLWEAPEQTNKCVVSNFTTLWLKVQTVIVRNIVTITDGNHPTTHHFAWVIEDTNYVYIWRSCKSTLTPFSKA